MKNILTLLLTLALQSTLCVFHSEAQPRMRVIIDNDFAGDPDGMFQLAHHLLSTSVDIRGIICSEVANGGGFCDPYKSVEIGQKKANEMIAMMGMSDKYHCIAGSAMAMTDSNSPLDSEGAQLIIREALREDAKGPLFVVCGGALTNIASAILMKPEISHRLTVIWIGGQEYPDYNPILPPNGTKIEYNLKMDIPSVQAIFNLTDVALWQVPRDAYRQCMVGTSELMTQIMPYGKIGENLTAQITDLMDKITAWGGNLGEVYILGDQPLVLLTTLQSGFEPDPSSCHYFIHKAPLIADDGSYIDNPNGREIRIYDRIDTRLLFADFYAKLQLVNNRLYIDSL